MINQNDSSHCQRALSIWHCHWTLSVAKFDVVQGTTAWNLATTQDISPLPLIIYSLGQVCINSKLSFEKILAVAQVGEIWNLNYLGKM